MRPAVRAPTGAQALGLHGPRSTQYHSGPGWAGPAPESCPSGQSHSFCCIWLSPLLRSHWSGGAGSGNRIQTWGRRTLGWTQVPPTWLASRCCLELLRPALSLHSQGRTQGARVAGQQQTAGAQVHTRARDTGLPGAEGHGHRLQCRG